MWTDHWQLITELVIKLAHSAYAINRKSVAQTGLLIQDWRYDFQFTERFSLKTILLKTFLKTIGEEFCDKGRHKTWKVPYTEVKSC